METESLSVLYGVASAAVWGTGDFCGGLAAKRANVNRVVLLAHLFGLQIMVLLAFILHEQAPEGKDLLFGSLAGLAGMVGVLAFYQGLAQSKMGVIAPLAAVVTALIPLVVGITVEGFPSSLQLAGIAIALTAVWFLAGGGDLPAIQWRELSLPALAGMGFALFLILIDQVNTGAVFWPLAAARGASVVVLLAATRLRVRSLVPPSSQLFVIALAGIFDAGGNALFALAAQTGRLDISAVLSSLYPASTMLLAWLFLGERLSVGQGWGAALAMVALVLVAS